MHNTGEVLMGSTTSNIREVTNKVGSIEAGIAVRLKSDGTISIAKADGELLGLSLGKDLSNTDKTAICRKGLRVPVKLTAAFNPTVGAVVSLSDTTGLAIASGVGATAVNAVYASGRIVGKAEDGTEVGAALVDFPGGL